MAVGSWLSRPLARQSKYEARCRRFHRRAFTPLTPAIATSRSADVVIVGAGLIGKACAAALAERGARVLLLQHPNSGEASIASAGMLAPSVERADGPAHDLAVAARDRYPEYLGWLRERSGVNVPLNRLGILQVALSPAGVKGLRRSAGTHSEWLDKPRLSSLEPALSHALGALYSPDDGCVDSAMLLTALDALLARAPLVRHIQARVTSVATRTGGALAMDATGTRYDAGHVLLAAGAWTGGIDGARLARLVEPVRGQLVSYASAPCRHTLYGPRGYLVPRGESTIAGSTMERVGFASGTTEEGIAKVRAAGEEICPALASGPPQSAWAGLRPVTPDLLPLVGPDPDAPRVLYATGHSRNGVLLAPLTAEIISGIIFEDVLNLDAAQYHPGRF